ncbi:MAG: phosphopantetheine-binding protein, partial [Candidatus Binatia bacterium]
RGFRIETDEIETVLRQHPAVWETVVIAREDVPGDKRLVAYVVPGREATLNAGELRDFLKTKLPHYMIPSAFVFLDVLPLTPNGKIDRKALPIPDQNRPELEESYAAPCTQVEEALARIWAEVLKVERVGVHDNFFDLGGHSLLAVRVITEIEKTLGKKLRLSALFQAPTVEQLAKLLGQEVRAESWSSLMALQPNGSKPPFFWIHGEASDAFLPRYLGPDQPVYGIMHQGLDGTRLRYTSVETIAAHYLSEIRSVQPHGPYFLGGYCFGGLVGFEIAHQLRQVNEEAGLLVVLDPVDLNDCKAIAGGDLRESTKSLAGRASRQARILKSLGAKKKLGYLSERLTAKLKSTPAIIRNVAKKSACRLYLSVGRRIHPSLRSFYILGVYEGAMEDYLPRKQPGELIVFNCAKGINEPQNWATLAGGFKMHTVPGDHHQILREPNARVWAEQLKICLDRAQTAMQTK